MYGSEAVKQADCISTVFSTFRRAEWAERSWRPKDYSTKDHRMQTAHQNTYFLERYGRNDFQALGSPMEVQHSLGYLMKYIEKSGERLVYGGDLPTYFVSDIMDEDIVCPFGIDDRKAILADDFTCISDGEVMGTVSKEVIEKMSKAN